MTADHEAKAADSQAADQGALDVVALALDEAEDALHYVALNADEQYRFMAQRVLSALAEAGYTVVKTEDVRWEYGFVFDDSMIGSADDEGTFDSAEAARTHANSLAIDAADTYRIYRRHPAPLVEPGPWVPVPEGSAEEAGGECRCEQIRAAYHGKPGSAGAAARAGVSTVCAVHGDLALSEGSADRGSEEGGER